MRHAASYRDFEVFQQEVFSCSKNVLIVLKEKKRRRKLKHETPHSKLWSYADSDTSG